jgi:hypothetical protein
MDKRLCKDYCRWAQHCYAKGEIGLDPDDCPTAWRVEELAASEWDSHDIVDDSSYQQDEEEEDDGEV